MHSLINKKMGHMGIWWPEVEVNKANFGKLKAGGIERTEEGELPQGRGESLVAQLDSAVTQGGVNLREGTLASHSTKYAWLDSRQKSARSMEAASCATEN